MIMEDLGKKLINDIREASKIYDILATQNAVESISGFDIDSLLPCEIKDFKGEDIKTIVDAKISVCKAKACKSLGDTIIKLVHNYFRESKKS